MDVILFSVIFLGTRCRFRASLIAQLIKNRLQCKRPRFDSWVGKIHWRRYRLLTLVFLGFSCGSAGEESTCNVGDLGSIPGLGRSPGEGKGYPPQCSGLENSMGCNSLWSCKESDTTEQLSLTFTSIAGISSVQFSRSVVSNSLWPHGLQPARLLCPWDSPGKNTGAGSHSLLQGVFPT